MSENLYIRFEPTKTEENNLSDRLQWLSLDDATGEINGRGQGQPADLAAILRDGDFDGEVRVLAPTESVLLTKASVPSRNQGKILQAVPFVVEEEIASDIDDCHFAIGERNEDGSVNVAVVDKSEISNWLSVLAEEEIIPDSIKAEVLQLPFDNQPVMLLEDNKLLYRRSPWQGMATDKDLLLTLASLSPEVKLSGLKIILLKQTETVTSEAIEEDDKAYIQAIKDNLQEQIEGDAGVEISIETKDGSGLEVFARNYDVKSIELLQGDYRVEKKKKNQPRSTWKLAVVFAGCAFALQLLILLTQGIFLDSQASRYEEEVKNLYAKTFPKDKNVRDIRRRWQAHLNGGNNPEGDFMQLLGIAGSGLAGSTLVLENINYNKSRGDLVLLIRAPRFEDLASLNQQLSEKGLETQIGNVSQDGQSVRGTLKIKDGSGG